MKVSQKKCAMIYNANNQVHHENTQAITIKTKNRIYQITLAINVVSLDSIPVFFTKINGNISTIIVHIMICKKSLSKLSIYVVQTHHHTPAIRIRGSAICRCILFDFWYLTKAPV